LQVFQAHFYARYRSKKDITFITGLMSTFIKSNSDELMLPQRYSEIEKQPIKIKPISQNISSLCKQ